MGGKVLQDFGRVFPNIKSRLTMLLLLKIFILISDEEHDDTAFLRLKIGENN